MNVVSTGPRMGNVSRSFYAYLKHVSAPATFNVHRGLYNQSPHHRAKPPNEDFCNLATAQLAIELGVVKAGVRGAQKAQDI